MLVFLPSGYASHEYKKATDAPQMQLPHLQTRIAKLEEQKGNDIFHGNAVIDVFHHWHWDFSVGLTRAV